MTERKDWTTEYLHQLELQRKRRQWEEERRQRQEQEQRDRARAELESYLSRRAKTWHDTTGSAPSRAVLEKWQGEFLDAKELEAEAERAERLAKAEAAYDF